MRSVYLVTVFLVVLTVSLLGFRGGVFTRPPIDVFPDWAFPSMRNQAKYKPQGAGAFFADGRADRAPPPGVVPASLPLREDCRMYEGKEPGGAWLRGFPPEVAVDRRLLERGRDRFTIYCAPCHGAAGDGNGVTKRYGMGSTPSYHDDRLRQMPEGQIFDTITRGKPPAYNMNPYADKLTPGDRWAVVAYVRALQRAQTGAVRDVPANHRSELGLK